MKAVLSKFSCGALGLLFSFSCAPDKPNQFAGEPTLEAIYYVLKQDLPHKREKVVKALSKVEDLELFLTTCDRCVSSDNELVRSTAFLAYHSLYGLLSQVNSEHLIDVDFADNYSDESIIKMINHQWKNRVIFDRVAKDKSFEQDRFPTFIKVTDEIMKENVEAVNKRHTK